MASRNPKKPAGIAGLYDLERTIGKGHFAVVKSARHVFTGERVAVKVIDKTKLDEASASHLRQEVLCMKLVQHPHVVKLYEVIDTETKLYLILELGDGGDMYDYIMKHDDGLDESIAQRYFRQIVLAINYCHKLHVVHRDLKPENVVFFEKLGLVKLTDFGFSNKFVPGKPLDTSCGSLAYSAPEILLGDNYDPPAVDVWSLGVILFMLIVGSPPFDEANDSETLTMIMDCKYTIPERVSPSCQDLIQQMLVREPSERITLDDILLHPWVSTGHEDTNGMAPLVSSEMLTHDDRNFIVKKMIEGKIATKDEVLTALEGDGYNHITATFFLLAERHLRRQLHEQQMHHHHNQSPQAPHSAGAPSSKPYLSPLALSPRVQPNLSASQTQDPQSRSIVDSLVSPSPVTGRPPLVSSAGTGQRVSFEAPSPMERPKTAGSQFANQGNIYEDPIEEDDEDLTGDYPCAGLASAGTSRGRMEWRGGQRSREDTSTSEGDSSDHSRSSSLERGDSANGKPAKISKRRTATLRPLKTVRSSPNMLNEICEESEGELESKLLKMQHSPIPPQAEPARYIQRSEPRPRKRLTQKGPSCSSSDASDNEDSDPSKKKVKDKPKHRGFVRRDSSDHSSDTDAGPGSAGFGSASSRSIGRDGGGGGYSGKGKADHGKSSKSQPAAGGGHQRGTHHRTRAMPPKRHDVCRVLSQSIPEEDEVKSPNSSRHGSLPTPEQRNSPPNDVHRRSTASPVVRNIKPVEIADEEKRYQSHTIYVRSKNFADLIQLFKDEEDSVAGDIKRLSIRSIGRTERKTSPYRYKDLSPVRCSSGAISIKEHVSETVLAATLHTSQPQFELSSPGRVLVEYCHISAKSCTVG